MPGKSVVVARRKAPTKIGWATARAASTVTVARSSQCVHGTVRFAWFNVVMGQIVPYEIVSGATF
jgi:hypothetical protein